jgi:hypothetical protein
MLDLNPNEVFQDVRDRSFINAFNAPAPSPQLLLPIHRPTVPPTVVHPLVARQFCFRFPFPVISFK